MISFKEGNEKFNFRVGGILLSPDQKKILIHRKSDFDFYLLPGGRVEMLEDTKNAIVRELKEELDIDVEVDKLLYILENFFELNGTIYHEISFNYLLKTTNEDIFKETEEFSGVEGEEYKFKWVNRNDLDSYNFKPEFVIDLLKDLPKETVHIIKDER